MNFPRYNYRNLVEENGHSAVKAETVVVTNSDYIVERLLGSGELCNISGADLSAVIRDIPP